MTLRRPAVAMLFVAVAGLSCSSDSPDAPGTVLGTVRDSEAHTPLSGAEAMVATRSAVSGADGSFVLEEVPAGPATLTVALEGYQRYEAPVEVPVGSGVTVQVELVASSIPATPNGLEAFGASDPPDVIELRWTPSPSTASYNLYWSTDPGVTPATGERISVPGTSYTHTGRTPGTTYYYVITGVNENGQGPPSGRVGATPGTGIFFPLVRPGAGAIVGDHVDLLVGLDSDLQVVSVVVSVAGRTAELLGDPPGHTWRGGLDLTGVAHGSHELAITASAGNGVSARATVEVLLDRPPTLQVNLPLDGTVAQIVQVNATCSDEDPAGCVATRAFVNDQQLVGSQSVNGTLVLRGGDEFVIFEGVDGHAQTGSARRRVIVETSPRLVPEAVGSSGFVVAADETRLLISETNENRNELRVRERASGAETIVTDEELLPFPPLLVDGGVIFHTGEPARSWLWRPGMTTVQLPSFVLSAAGPFIVYETPTTPSRLERRNVLTNETEVVTADVVSGAVAVANGDVVYGTIGGLFRFRDAGTVTLDTEAAIVFTPQAADEASAVVTRREQANFDRHTLNLYDGSGPTLLAPEQEFGFPQVALAGGWVAFQQLVLDIPQVWVRSPAGEQRQVSFFNYGSGLEGIGPAGEVLFTVGPSSGEGRYLVPPGGTAERISGSHGTGIFLDGIAHLMLGNTLFRVQ